ncbi:Fatty-acid-coa ligase [Globisporangium polare]
MSDLIANVVGAMAVEVVAAASFAAASVAVAAVYTGRQVVNARKRKHAAALAAQEQSEVEEGAESSEAYNSSSSSPPLKRRRHEPEREASPSHGKPHAKETHQLHHGSNGATFTTEVVVDELKRKAVGKWRKKIVYTFLDDRGKESVNYTYEDIDKAARRIAATLQTEGNLQKGDRVMLCYPPGLDFAMGFWGCLYAGAIGIPVYPPYPGTLAKDLPKFNRMVEDSGAKVILTNKTYHLASKMATVKGFFSADKSATTWPADVQWFTTDTISDSVGSLYNDSKLNLTIDDLAFFQYSSGSTSAPKAVMISHGNLRAQLKTWDSIMISDTLVSWLPSYHDMGLVGFIITPCITGAQCVSMSPISFIKDPTIWMRIVTKYKATHVCAPNFGYALAARKTSDAEAAKMDLSTLKQAICAAEPIRKESLDAFISKFEKAAGFDPKTFNCGYGLAEVTLVCTGQDPMERKLPSILSIKKSTVEAERKVVVAAATEPVENVMTLVGCGKPMPTFRVAVVDPDSKKQLKEGQVGEIWIEGPSVAVGYWNRPEYTEEMFGAQIAGEEDPNETYLRTGDMGFLHHGEVFVTGRLKDLIIIRGRNVVPQDVEASIERAHDHVRPGCTAAFSIEKNQEEALVLVAEVKNGSSKEICEEICREIVKVVLSEHQLRCEAIVLLRQKTIPKTTSGKIQRSAAKSKFLTNSLPKPIYEYKSKDAHKPAPKQAPVAAAKQTEVVREVETSTDLEVSAEKPVQKPEDIKSEEEILAWLVERIAKEVEPTEDGSEPTPIDPSTPWASYGLDSIAIVGLSSELGEFLSCIVPPSAFFQYDTPLKLASAPGLATGDLESDETNQPSGTELASTIEEIDASCYDFNAFPEIQDLFSQMKEFEDAGLRVPYLETLTAEKRKMVNFNTYNYLGNASNHDVALASKKAIEEYGTTMSSSPIVGQTLINVELEAALCTFFRAEASILYVGGWVANVATIDSLVSKGDLILCDALNHNSCVTGQRLSGATILPFPHNDTAALERMLSKLRTKYRRVLIVAEGVYSMDGDIPNLPEIIRIKKQYKSILFLDEAHSFGTMGASGRGLVEHFNVDPQDVDVRMGTMSKALGSVGGFILGSTAVIKYLKHCTGGFVFSVGLSPACAGAALKSIQLMTKSPSRTLKLQERSGYFFDLCVKAKLKIAESTFRGAPVVVVIIGSTIATAKASEFLAEKGKVNVKPIVYPAVEEGKCRLRFFISSLHTKKQLEHAVELLTAYLAQGKLMTTTVAAIENGAAKSVTENLHIEKISTSNTIETETPSSVFSVEEYEVTSSESAVSSMSFSHDLTQAASSSSSTVKSVSPAAKKQKANGSASESSGQSKKQRKQKAKAAKLKP